MSGWKTWVAAIASMAWGIGGMVAGVHGPDGMVAFVTSGLGMIGIGHKIEKSGRLG